jgi:glycosyltransferase involved in cell wall biosynthesis
LKANVTSFNNSQPAGMPHPKVSVAMITYNHEKFIIQAVESVMMQETTFPYELVISEDCSTDRTRAIVLDLQQKYPDKIRVILPEKNLGMMRNSFQTLQACNGDYVARLEGDDYWTDPRKLQLQSDLLDAHPDYSACFTRACVVSGQDSTVSFYIPADSPARRQITTEDLIGKNCIATASVMYRNFFQEVDLEPLLASGLDDWPVHLLASLRGPIGYLNDVMAAYRQHAGGIWTGQDETARLTGTVKFYRILKQVMPSRYARQISERIVKTCQLIALELLRRGDRRQARNWVFQSLAAIPPVSLSSFGWFIKRSIILLLGVYGMPITRVEAALHR